MERFSSDVHTSEVILPTPMQLHKLSAVALSNAKIAKKLTRFNRLEPTYGWVEHYLSGDEDEEGAAAQSNSKVRKFERFSGRHARRVFTTADQETHLEDVAFYADRWSLRYRELRQQHVMDDFWLSELKQYSFEWDNDEAYLSQCQTKEIPSIEQSEIDRILALSDDDIELLSTTPTSSKMETVDGLHVGRLTGEMRRRRHAIGRSKVENIGRLGMAS